MPHQRFIWVMALLFALSCKSTFTAPAPDSPANLPAPIEYVSPWKEFRNSPQRSFDLIHTRLDLSFDWDQRTVIGQATLTLKPYFYPQSILVLDAKDFQVNFISMSTENDDENLRFEYDGNILFIELESMLTRKDTFSIIIDYVARPYLNASPDNRGLYFINSDGQNPYLPKQIWTQGATEYNSYWFPTIDAPNERCTQEVILTVDDKYQTLSNGTLISSQRLNSSLRRDHWKLNKPHAPYLFSVVIGEFNIVEDSAQVPVKYYVDKDFDFAENVFGNTPEMISFFSEKLGYKYPWPKYHQVVVHEFVTGAMENTTVSTFMEDVMTSPRELDREENWDKIISHELFHQWFGDLVTCESWGQIPLNESLASYGEHLWMEYKYGDEAAEFHGIQEMLAYLDEAEGDKKSLIRYYYDSPEDMFDRHSYEKGARVLHMLRLYIGDEAFFHGLNQYLKAHEFQSVELSDFRKSFEHVTGQDLSWFFLQWFESPGHPQLSVRHDHREDTLYIEVSQEQNLELYPLYYLPLNLDLIVQDSIFRYPLSIIDRNHVFRLPLKRAPDGLILDGDYQLVGELTHQKSPEELLAQLKSDHSLAARYEAVSKLLSGGFDGFVEQAISIGLDDRSGDILQLTLDLILDKDYPLTSIQIEKISNISMSSNATVRSSAIYILYLKGHVMKSELQEFLTIPDYQIKGVALELLMEIDSINGEKYFEQFKNELNANIIFPLAYYINDHKRTGKSEWYIQKLMQIRPSEKFYLLLSFNEYLIGASDEDKKLAIPYLNMTARENSNMNLRWLAYTGLTILEEFDGVQAMLTQIKDQEKNPELLRLYEGT